MGKLKYCIKAVDLKSGKKGAFLYEEGDYMTAISPVFEGLPDLFTWMELTGYKRLSAKYLGSWEVVKDEKIGTD